MQYKVLKTLTLEDEEKNNNKNYMNVELIASLTSPNGDFVTQKDLIAMHTL